MTEPPPDQEPGISLQGRILELEERLAQANAKILDLQHHLAYMAAEQGKPVQKNQEIVASNQSGELCRHIVEKNPVGLAIVAGKDLVIEMANPSYQAITPFPEQNPLGYSWKEIWPGERGFQVDALLRDVMENDYSVRTDFHRREFPDGSIHMFSMVLNPIIYEDAPAVLVILWETTDFFNLHDEAEHAVAKQAALLAENQSQRDFLEHMLASIEDGFFALDRSWRFTYVNRLAAEIAAPQDELLGCNIWETWPILCGTDLELNLFQAMEQNVNTRFQFQSPYNHSWYDIKVYPFKDGVSVIVSDRTKQYHNEQALQNSEERFRQLADAMPQLVWTARPDGVVDYYNQRYTEFKGISPASAGVWEWAPVLHPDHVELTKTLWENCISTGETYQVEHKVLTADGTYRWFLSRGIPVYDSGGNIVKWYGTATDINDQKLAEAAVQDYAARLEQSNQELEQFAFIASHDMQEPLRKIEVFSSALLNTAGPKIDESERDYLIRMGKATRRMRTMINDLLELSRVTTKASPFEKIDLSEPVRGAVSDLEVRLHQTKGEVEVGPLPCIQADPIQMRQLFQNLVGNALKFHQPGKPPTVRIMTGEVTPTTVQILVEDNGIGFSPSNLGSLFQPFRRLVGRSEYEGSGIGLAICRKIVERHGGTIGAESNPGAGSIFKVLLPRQHYGRMIDEGDAR